ncbi:hypothetical protein CEUSTIGMA_g11108.t1 [Chlamydomonas eustigma]|uniref:Uncharacterized protein n=1 Tax=Chlamydomonas eustigma TaxID=1157962 RepID=A0A250XKX8_9CHLO|nr:hypothetical protein CEUSTIGMA_g11108.t1 [Chlamydomonas eustigma]|eukprot:GAX83683.1 hypothetical protein CEUSTIGMA_g11108.t1 [Chlamydomonas eustigma]
MSSFHNLVSIVRKNLCHAASALDNLQAEFEKSLASDNPSSKKLLYKKAESLSQNVHRFHDVACELAAIFIMLPLKQGDQEMSSLLSKKQGQLMHHSNSKSDIQTPKLPSASNHHHQTIISHKKWKDPTAALQPCGREGTIGIAASSSSKATKSQQQASAAVWRPAGKTSMPRKSCVVMLSRSNVDVPVIRHPASSTAYSQDQDSHNQHGSMNAWCHSESAKDRLLQPAEVSDTPAGIMQKGHVIPVTTTAYPRPETIASNAHDLSSILISTSRVTRGHPPAVHSMMLPITCPTCPAHHPSATSPEVGNYSNYDQLEGRLRFQLRDLQSAVHDRSWEVECLHQELLAMIKEVEAMSTLALEQQSHIDALTHQLQQQQLQAGHDVALSSSSTLHGTTSPSEFEYSQAASKILSYDDITYCAYQMEQCGGLYENDNRAQPPLGSPREEQQPGLEDAVTIVAPAARLLTREQPGLEDAVTIIAPAAVLTREQPGLEDAVTIIAPAAVLTREQPELEDAVTIIAPA